ncbi:hypothetical protein ACFO0N_10895 [Halobium salinum]|uniref:Uncharacterized protein n=1 Tax=Halobium salinum TaxID=1364940 RepID=A0ABD5PDA3_9EURY|nr:hypothetical protein [Halobium salinum]
MNLRDALLTGMLYLSLLAAVSFGLTAVWYLYRTAIGDPVPVVVLFYCLAVSLGSLFVAAMVRTAVGRPVYPSTDYVPKLWK